MAFAEMQSNITITALLLRNSAVYSNCSRFSPFSQLITYSGLEIRVR